MNVLIIDNYDSFTFNLYQYIGEILTDIKNKNGNDFTITVKRNNELTLDDVKALNPDRIIISPGPGSPDDPAYFGVCGEVITEIGKTVPLLGVCLGVQGMAPIRHDGKGVYHGLPQNIDIMRYHSLMVEAMSLPDCLEITSLVQNDKNLDKSMKDASLLGDEIMGIRHKEYPIQGVQYHPESFATEGARNLLKNFLVQV